MVGNKNLTAMLVCYRLITPGTYQALDYNTY